MEMDVGKNILKLIIAAYVARKLYKLFETAWNQPNQDHFYLGHMHHIVVEEEGDEQVIQL